MDVWALEPAQALPVVFPQPRRLSEVRAAFAALRAELDALRQRDDVQVLEAERSELIARFNQDALEREAEWDRLELGNHLLRTLTKLDGSFIRFEEQHLESFEVIETLSPEYRDDPFSKISSPIKIVDAVTVRREPSVQDAARDLLERQREMAELRYRVQVVGQPHETFLLRVLPETGDESARRWTRRLAVALARALMAWGNIHILCRDEGDAWIDASRQGEDGDRPEVGMLREESDPPTGCALRVRGYGLRALVVPELGYVMDTYHSGPDIICDLARLEMIPLESGQDPCALLVDRDRSVEAWRARRREGAREPHPRPCLPIRQAFESGRPTQTSSPASEEPTDIFVDHVQESYQRRFIERMFVLGREAPE